MLVNVIRPITTLVISGPGQMTAVRPSVQLEEEAGGDWGSPASQPTCDHHNNLHHRNQSHHGTTSSQERCLHQVYCQPAQGERRIILPDRTEYSEYSDLTNQELTPAKGAKQRQFSDLWFRP